MPGLVASRLIDQETAALEHFDRANICGVDIGEQPSEVPVRLGLLDQMPNRQCRESLPTSFLCDSIANFGRSPRAVDVLEVRSSHDLSVGALYDKGVPSPGGKAGQITINVVADAPGRIERRVARVDMALEPSAIIHFECQQRLGITFLQGPNPDGVLVHGHSLFCLRRVTRPARVAGVRANASGASFITAGQARPFWNEV